MMPITRICARCAECFDEERLTTADGRDVCSERCAKLYVPAKHAPPIPRGDFDVEVPEAPKTEPEPE